MKKPLCVPQRGFLQRTQNKRNKNSCVGFVLLCVDHDNKWEYYVEKRSMAGPITSRILRQPCVFAGLFLLFVGGEAA